METFKKEIEKLLKKKAIQIALVVLVIGFVLTNFWTLVWWAIIGAVATIVGVVVYSFIEAAKETSEDSK